MTIFTHPLKWPEGWGRSPTKVTGQFGKAETKWSPDRQNSWQSKGDITMEEAAKRVRYELQRLGVSEDDCMISTQLRTNMAGLPRGDQGEPADTGVAVYWTPKGKTETKVMAIDRYTRVRDNLAAIAKTLEAMRAIERHGGAQILERAFTGFDALPPPKSPWEILGLKPDSTAEAVSFAFREKSKTAHPDRGGSNILMAELVEARDRALALIRERSS